MSIKGLQPALSGRQEESEFEKTGFLWVKLPVGSRGGSLRAWTKKYASISSELFLLPDSVSTCAFLLIRRSDKSDAEIAFKKRLTSQNTILFRSK